MSIKVVSVAPLSHESGADRDRIDRELGDALVASGAVVLSGQPSGAEMTLRRAALLNSLYQGPLDERMALVLHRSDPRSSRMWRGYQCRVRDGAIYSEMFDIGRRRAAVGIADFDGYENRYRSNAVSAECNA